MNEWQVILFIHSLHLHTFIHSHSHLSDPSWGRIFMVSKHHLLLITNMKVLYMFQYQFYNSIAINLMWLIRSMGHPLLSSVLEDYCTGLVCWESGTFTALPSFGAELVCMCETELEWHIYAVRLQPGAPYLSPRHGDLMDQACGCFNNGALSVWSWDKHCSFLYTLARHWACTPSFCGVYVLFQKPAVDSFTLVPHAVLCSVSATEWPPAEVHNGILFYLSSRVVNKTYRNNVPSQ